MDSTRDMNNSYTSLGYRSSSGMVTGVRYITIQNGTRYSFAGTIGGAVFGGLVGNIVGNGHSMNIGGAAAGVVAGQALQSHLGRNHFVELFIRPDDGRDFFIVQPISGADFFVGQRVEIIYRCGNVIITPE